MKCLVLFLALCAAPRFVFAQTTAHAPILIAKTPKVPLPKAQELFDHLFAPYEAAKTFRGTFDVFIKGDDPTNKASEIHLKTLFRFNDKGDLSRQDATLRFVGRADPKQQPTIHFMDDGRAPLVAVLDQKLWWSANPRDNNDLPILTSILKPLLESVVQALNKTPNFVPVISRGMDAGRPVFVLTAQGTGVLRVVVDAQTRALRSLELANSISIYGSRQSFDEPIADEEFAWTPPADFKRVAEGDVALPLGMTVEKRTTEAPPSH